MLKVSTPTSIDKLSLFSSLLLILSFHFQPPIFGNNFSFFNFSKYCSNEICITRKINSLIYSFMTLRFLYIKKNSSLFRYITFSLLNQYISIGIQCLSFLSIETLLDLPSVPLLCLLKNLPPPSHMNKVGVTL